MKGCVVAINRGGAVRITGEATPADCLLSKMENTDVRASYVRDLMTVSLLLEMDTKAGHVLSWPLLLAC